jgi:hypothetical protein
MIKRLKVLIASLLLAGAVLVPAQGALAFDFFKSCSEVNSAGSSVCQDKNQTQNATDNSIYGPNGIITKIANIVAIIVGIAAVVVIIVAGIQYMLSTGDPTKVNNAKNAIIYAVIGLVIAVVARSLVLFIIGRISK